MSWTNELYQVYEKQCGRDTHDSTVLLPVSHSTANAQIEVTLRADGTFVGAVQLTKEEGLNTIIPVTEDSGGRTSGICAMPLADKLIYLCGDYNKYVNKNNEAYFESYIDQLTRWKDSTHSHPSVRAIHAYLSEKTLMQDLIDCHVLQVNAETGMLEEKVNIANIAQQDAFVRFRVHGDTPETWLDTSLYDSFIAWNGEEMAETELCYATGEQKAVTYKHPSKIRNTGDKAKLISSNDESGFTYRGRFADKTEAISVSYDFSQKMHNALRWLIQRQGIPFDTLTLVVWTSALEEEPDLLGAGCDPDDDEYFGETEAEYDSETKYHDFLRRRIFGTQDFDITSRVMLMGVDAATTGRLSISIYEELEHSQLLEQLMKWHTETAVMRFNSKQRVNRINSFAVKEIINCAYGMEGGKGYLETKPEIIKENVLRLLPCITQGRAIPADLVQNLVKKASNPLAYEQSYNHRNVIEAACGMIRKQNIDRKRGVQTMAYDPNETDRSYLFGCLLAIADAAEYASYDDADKGKRVTNAKRYWSMFAKRPSTTWKLIENQLRVYMIKLGGKSIYFEKMLNEVMGKLPLEAFSDNSPLTSAYLLGYHHYNAVIYKDHKKTEEE
ncbi:MAG: type I-C CRISPR-associated protein Cas8c/Csd1 [Oscillospiraceae bacterium]|nr:type I-C CRISPR-associated protein Cas8c/Csd1 [Oscillospiraceae bacterium]